MHVKFSFVYRISGKGSWNPPQDVSYMKYSPNIINGLKDDVCVNHIPCTRLFKIDNIEVLGLRERLVIVYQLLIEMICNRRDVILDFLVGVGPWFMLKTMLGITSLWMNPWRTSSKIMLKLLPRWSTTKKKTKQFSQSQCLRLSLFNMHKYQIYFHVVLIFCCFYRLRGVFL